MVEGWWRGDPSCETKRRAQQYNTRQRHRYNIRLRYSDRLANGANANGANTNGANANGAMQSSRWSECQES
jgi:hypothetical protein